MVDFFGSSKHKDPHQQAEHVLESAHKKAEKIVEKAIAKSEEIVAQMDVFKEQMEKEMKMAFSQAANSYIHTITVQSKEFSDACTRLIPPLKDTFTQEAAKITSEFRTQLLAMVAPIEKMMQSEMQTARQELQRKMTAEWENIQKEMQAYKVQKMQTVDAELKTEISRMASEVLGKTLSVAEQERLVIEALEKAKAGGVFE